MSAKPCKRDDCERPKMPGIHFCYWHDLLRKPIEEQIAAAKARVTPNSAPGESRHRARVPAAEWPAGERWCAGCQGFVPLFYCSGSRCKAHAAAASHDSRIQAVYGIDRADYAALLEIQGGRCYVCGQWPKTKRLAVDHDHQTGEVRGLLCADVERGCNKAVLGSIEARSVDGPIPALRRLIDYLEHTPYQRLKEIRDATATGPTADPASSSTAEGDSSPGGAGDPLRALTPSW